MQDFGEMESREALPALASLLCRSTLLRAGAPAAALLRYAEAVNNADALFCVQAYHELYESLLLCPARRVSGCLWQDYLLHTLLLTAHPFARAAAAGRMDAALLCMMREELSILASLFTLTDTALARFARERERERKFKPRQARDDIEMFSTAVWSGGSARPLPAPAAQQAPAQGAAPEGHLRFTPFVYGEGLLSKRYVADEALEELYARLLNDPAWDKQLESLRAFFASYGCGVFLEGRVLRAAADGSFHALPERLLRPLEGPLCACFPAERERLLDELIRFMQGEEAAPVLLCGGPGMGKRAQVFALAHELPEVRLVLAAPGTALPALFSALEAQPLKCMLFFDGLSPAALDPGALVLCPPNVLPVFACEDESARLEGALCLRFPSLRPESFQGLVRAWLEGMEDAGPALVDAGRVANACVDHQLEARGHLSAAAARLLAREIAGLPL